MEELAKTRSDAWGEQLTDTERWDIFRLTKPPREGEDENRVVLRSYEDSKTYIADSLRLSPPSRAGWYRFLARMRKEERLQLICRVSGSAESAHDLAAEAKIDSAKAGETFRALAVDAAMNGDDKAASLYASAASMFLNSSQKEVELKLKDRAQSVKEEELRIAQEKLKIEQQKNAKATETIKDTKLTPEEREQKLKEIFGL